MRLEYAMAHRLSALHDELLAAGIAPTYVGDDPDDPDGVVLEVPDGTDPAAVEAVVTAHDAAAVDAARQAAQTAFASDVQAIKTFMAAPNGSATDTQRDAVLKAFVRVARRAWVELRDE